MLSPHEFATLMLVKSCPTILISIGQNSTNCSNGN